MVGIFAGPKLIAGLLAAGQVIFDPGVLLDLTLEDLFGRFDATARQVLSFGDDADADHVIVLRDVPEPAFLRHVSHRGRAFVQAGIAFGAAVIGPDGDFVQVRIANAPVVADGRESFLARAIDDDARLILDDASIFFLRAHADDAPTFLDQFLDRDFLFEDSAFRAGVFAEHGIEFGT